MTGRRLSRFLHLERPRAAEPPREAMPPAGVPAPPAGRFDAVEQPTGTEPRGATGARLERFEPARLPEAELELATRGASARPFTRCQRCEMDHGLGAAVCSQCGDRLDTPAQLAFNEQLWAARQAEAAREAEAGAALRAAQERDREEEARARRALAESMAREVGDRERRRLGGAGPGGEAALGLVLLRAIPHPRWKLAAAGAAAATVLGLLAGGLVARSPGVVFAGLVVGIVLAVPRGRARRRW